MIEIEYASLGTQESKNNSKTVTENYIFDRYFHLKHIVSIGVGYVK